MARRGSAKPVAPLAPEPVGDLQEELTSISQSRGRPRSAWQRQRGAAERPQLALEPFLMRRVH